jgi:aspartyl/asparaginyl beta-hydroxylase (cupin superfamily)/Tfp pilus assembly protein PilF
LNTAAALDEATILGTLQSAKAEAAAGRMAESDQILVRLAQAAPHHPAVLNELGVRMLDRGAADQAQALFTRATAANPNHPALWSNLAASFKALGRRAEEIEAIDKALQLEPRHVSSLLQKGAHFEETGNVRGAARVYSNLLAFLPPEAAAAPQLREAVSHAQRVVDQDLAALVGQLEEPLARVRERHGGKAQRRVDRCLDTLVGKRIAYHSKPTWMYMPELPAIDFFERADSPWLDAFEAATDEIRGELLRVLTVDREGLQPYLDFSADLPLDQFRELNRSRRWSAYFLWNQAKPVPGHIARCPVTARLLETAPRCRIEHRAPTAFYSILDANTKIPAHVGVTNTRCTVHLPLVVPPGCGFRVGSTTREWIPGEAWVFDDTIEHEAWNLSDTPRAILLFDIWNPLLTEAERDMIKTATEVYAEYYALPPEHGL